MAFSRRQEQNVRHLARKTMLPEVVGKRESEQAWASSSGQRGNSVNFQNTSYVTTMTTRQQQQQQELAIERLSSKRFSEGAAVALLEKNQHLKNNQIKVIGTVALAPTEPTTSDLQIGSGVIEGYDRQQHLAKKVAEKGHSEDAASGRTRGQLGAQRQIRSGVWGAGAGTQATQWAAGQVAMAGQKYKGMEVTEEQMDLINACSVLKQNMLKFKSNEATPKTTLKNNSGVVKNDPQSQQIEKLKLKLEQIRRNSDDVHKSGRMGQQEQRAEGRREQNGGQWQLNSFTNDSFVKVQKQPEGITERRHTQQPGPPNTHSSHKSASINKMSLRQKRIMSTDEPERVKFVQQNMPFQNLGNVSSEVLNQMSGIKSQQQVATSRGNSDSKLNNILPHEIQNLVRDNNYSSENMKQHIQIKFQSNSNHTNNKVLQQHNPSSSRSPPNQKKLRIIESDQMFNMRANQISSKNAITNVNSPNFKIKKFQDKMAGNPVQNDPHAMMGNGLNSNTSGFLNNILSQTTLAKMNSQNNPSNIYQGPKDHLLTSKAALSPQSLKYGAAVSADGLGGEQKHEYIYKFIKTALENQHPKYFNGNLNSKSQHATKDLSTEKSLYFEQLAGSKTNNNSILQPHSQEKHRDLQRIYDLRSTLIRNQPNIFGSYLAAAGQQQHNASTGSGQGVNDEILIQNGQKPTFQSPALEILSKHAQQKQMQFQKQIVNQNEITHKKGGLNKEHYYGGVVDARAHLQNPFSMTDTISGSMTTNTFNLDQEHSTHLPQQKPRYFSPLADDHLTSATSTSQCTKPFVESGLHCSSIRLSRQQSSHGKKAGGTGRGLKERSLQGRGEELRQWSEVLGAASANSGGLQSSNSKVRSALFGGGHYHQQHLYQHFMRYTQMSQMYQQGSGEVEGAKKQLGRAGRDSVVHPERELEQTLFNSIAAMTQHGQRVASGQHGTLGTGTQTTTNAMRTEHPQLNYRQSINSSIASNDYGQMMSSGGDGGVQGYSNLLNTDQLGDSILRALINKFGQKTLSIHSNKSKTNKGNYRNIPLSSMTIKKNKKIKNDAESIGGLHNFSSPFDDCKITGNFQRQNGAGLPQNFVNIDISSNNPILSLFLNNSQEKLAPINIWHVENNVVKDSSINQAIKLSNELIRIANLSYYHQTKSEFALSIKELRVMKQSGIHLNRMQLESKAYLKSREFQVLLKDKALKMLTTQLQTLQNLQNPFNAFLLQRKNVPSTGTSSTTGPPGTSHHLAAAKVSSNLSGTPGPHESKPLGAQATHGLTSPRRRKRTSEKASRRTKKRAAAAAEVVSGERVKGGKGERQEGAVRKVDQSFQKKSSKDKIGGGAGTGTAAFGSPKVGSDQIQQQYHTNYCKFFVGTGNNFQLVRQVVKNRWWFQMQEKADFHKCNLVWTSWFKQKLCNQLNSYYKDQQDANEIDKLTKHLVGFEPSRIKIYARMEDNHHLADKKCLFYALKQYYQAQGRCVFKDRVFPVTFHIKDSHADPEFKKLKECFEEYPCSIWIVKPGENTNRGYGICVVDNFKEINQKIKEILSESEDDDREHTVIVQKYIERPLLVYKRKFDIRVFGMLTTVNGIMRGYFYDEGYLRTSSKEYNLNQLANKYVHLTNDAIQQTAHDFGKFESGNKLSFSDFQNYLKITEDLKPEYKQDDSRVSFIKQILPQIRHLVTESFRAVAYNKIDPKRRNFCFEIFGFDFMIDEDFAVYLIEANTNPCLETNSSVLSRLIPVMLDSSFRIALDPLLPPPEMNFKRAHEALHLNRYVQVFDEAVERETLKNLYLISQHQQVNTSSKCPKEAKREKANVFQLVQESLSMQTNCASKLQKSKEMKMKEEWREVSGENGQDDHSNVTGNHTKMLQDAIKFHGELHAQKQLESIKSLN